MLSIKWKFLLTLILSIFATATTSIYITQHQQQATVLSQANEEKSQFSVIHNSENSEVYPERVNYKSIPLDSINSVLQGSNPKNLALSVIEDVEPEKGNHKVEVVYPHHNQALVTITHVPSNRKSAKFMKYRVELNTFGRSLLASSPPVWQIIWAGSQIQCKTGSRLNKQCN
jgi:hypothetical protein